MVETIDFEILNWRIAVNGTDQSPRNRFVCWSGLNFFREKIAKTLLVNTRDNDVLSKLSIADRTISRMRIACCRFRIFHAVNASAPVRLDLASCVPDWNWWDSRVARVILRFGKRRGNFACGRLVATRMRSHDFESPGPASHCLKIVGQPYCDVTKSTSISNRTLPAGWFSHKWKSKVPLFL